MSRLGTVGRCALVLVFFAGASNEADDAKAHAALMGAVARQPIELTAANEAQGLTKIMRALDEETSFDFTELPLTDAIKYLMDKHTIEIQLDSKGLEAESIGIDMPVTRNLRGTTLRSALRLMLRPLDLAYIVKDEVLLITTAKTASIEKMVRIYPVGDLTVSDATNEPSQAFAALVDIIKGTVEPRTWEHPGGAFVQAWPLGHSLVIRQTWAGHEEIELLLAGLRRSRDVEARCGGDEAIVNNR